MVQQLIMFSYSRMQESQILGKKALSPLTFWCPCKPAIPHQEAGSPLPSTSPSAHPQSRGGRPQGLRSGLELGRSHEFIKIFLRICKRTVWNFKQSRTGVVWPTA